MSHNIFSLEVLEFLNSNKELKESIHATLTSFMAQPHKCLKRTFYLQMGSKVVGHVESYENNTFLVVDSSNSNSHISIMDLASISFDKESNNTLRMSAYLKEL